MYNSRTVIGIGAALVLLGAFQSAGVAAPANKQVDTTAHTYNRARPAVRDAATPAQPPDDDRAASYSQSQQAPRATIQATPRVMRPTRITPATYDYGIYAARVVLEEDIDGDGFFYRFKLVFDADTDYYDADVYARLYLSYQGGPYYLYYTTDQFRIDGSAADDEYIVHTTLSSGYPSGYYDLAIDLYEAGTDALVASADAYTAPQLGALPLEDYGHELASHAGTSVFAGIALLEDRDHDGYFHSFRIEIDVDSPEGPRNVYANIDVRSPGGAWLHEFDTATFPVDGYGRHDTTFVDAAWQSGYPPGHYDFQITIRDADTGAVLTELGPSSPNLAAVPLEDAASDQLADPYLPPPPRHTVSHGHGGASGSGWSALGMLIAAAAFRRRARRA